MPKLTSIKKKVLVTQSNRKRITFQWRRRNTIKKTLDTRYLDILRERDSNKIRLLKIQLEKTQGRTIESPKRCQKRRYGKETN